MPERLNVTPQATAQGSGSIIRDQYSPIFVFGSSMNSSATRACCPGAEFLATAYLPDHDLCFPRWDEDQRAFIVGYQAAAGKRLWGVVWLIPQNERGSLDHAKGCRPGQPGHHYDRVPITVRLSDETPANVETYRVVAGQGGQPSKAHLDFIIAGAEEHNLPSEYIDGLKRTVTLEALRTDFRAVA
jgi:AIG2-like family